MHEIYNYHLNIYYVCNMVMSFYIAYTVLFSLCFFLFQKITINFTCLNCITVLSPMHVKVTKRESIIQKQLLLLWTIFYNEGLMFNCSSILTFKTTTMLVLRYDNGNISQDFNCQIFQEI